MTLRDFAQEKVDEVKVDPDLQDWDAVAPTELIKVGSSSSDSDESLPAPSESSSDDCIQPEALHLQKRSFVETQNIQVMMSRGGNIIIQKSCVRRLQSALKRGQNQHMHAAFDCIDSVVWTLS